MKKLFGFIQAASSIVLNERGSIGEVAEDSSADMSDSGADDSSSESVDFSDNSQDLDLSSEETETAEISASTEEELESEIQEAIENGADETQVQSMIRKYNLKIDGQEIEEEVDLDNEEEMIRTLQLAKKSHKTMQEKAELERATSQFLQNVRNNPFKALKELDPNFDEMSYVNEFVDKLIKENEMSPQEKEQARIKSEYEQLLAEKEQFIKEAQERKRQEETQVLVAQIKSEITKALEADEDLVVNDTNISLIAQEMARASEKKVDLSPVQALDIAKKRIQKEYNQYSNMFKSTASMKKYMGPELMEKLREDRAKIAQKQQEVKTAKANPVGGNKPITETKKNSVSISDILAGRASWEDYQE